MYDKFICIDVTGDGWYNLYEYSHKNSEDTYIYTRYSDDNGNIRIFGTCEACEKEAERLNKEN